MAKAKTTTTKRKKKAPHRTTLARQQKKLEAIVAESAERIIARQEAEKVYLATYYGPPLPTALEQLDRAMLAHGYEEEVEHWDERRGEYKTRIEYVSPEEAREDWARTRDPVRRAAREAKQAAEATKAYTAAADAINAADVADWATPAGTVTLTRGGMEAVTMIVSTVGKDIYDRPTREHRRQKLTITGVSAKTKPQVLITIMGVKGRRGRLEARCDGTAVLDHRTTHIRVELVGSTPSAAITLEKSRLQPDPETGLEAPTGWQYRAEKKPARWASEGRWQGEE
ncbi:MAG: hypothetical protein ACOY4R_14250 [Pseudomonadota bacterium]